MLARWLALLTVSTVNQLANSPGNTANFYAKLNAFS